MASQALLKAISAGRSRQVRLLLDSGCSADDADECGQTTLTRAVFIENEGNRTKILKMLLRKSAIVSKADIVGRNALIWACIYGRDKEVNLLLENVDIDLDLNSADVNGHTALYHAVSSGNAATVKIIVESLNRYDLSVDVPDYEGHSPLMLAVRLGYDVCASILVHSGKAKVGIGMKYPKDFVSAKKWAIHSLRDRERVLHKHTKFPPILKPDAQNKIKYKENRASRRGVKTPQFSESNRDSSPDSDISFPSDSSSYDNPSFDYPIKSFMNNYPTCNIPSSILAISPTSSTIVNASEDEVDSYSLPLDDKGSNVNATRYLPVLYGMLSDQMSSSFRLPVKLASSTPRKKIANDNTSTAFIKEDSTVSKSSKKGENDIRITLSFYVLSGL
jgi:hypothetical protein